MDLPHSLNGTDSSK